MAYVNGSEAQQFLEGIRDRLVIKDKTEAQALVASVSYPNCVYYTSDTHKIVVGGNVYCDIESIGEAMCGEIIADVFGEGDFGSSYEFAADTSDQANWDTSKIYYVPSSTAGIYNIYSYTNGAWSYTQSSSSPIPAANVSYDRTNTPNLGNGNVQSAVEALKSQKVEYTTIEGNNVQLKNGGGDLLMPKTTFENTIGEIAYSGWVNGVPTALRGSSVVNYSTVVDFTSLYTGYSYQHMVVDCNPGDVFIFSLSTKLSDAPVSYIDANNVVISRLVNTAASAKVWTDVTSVVPYGAVKAVFATVPLTGSYVHKKSNSFTEVEERVDTLGSDMYDLNGRLELDDVRISVASTMNIAQWNIVLGDASGSKGIVVEIPINKMTGVLFMSAPYYFRGYALCTNEFSWKTGTYSRQAISDTSTRSLDLASILAAASFTPNYFYAFVLSPSNVNYNDLEKLDLYIQNKGKVDVSPKKIICWGSSTTNGYTPYLQTALGDDYMVVNQGVGGELTNTILARLGSKTVYNTAAFVLPADSATQVNVSLSINPVSSQSSSERYNPCYVNGIKCIMTSGKLKRAESGTADLTIPAKTPIVLQSAAKRDTYASFMCLQLWGNSSADASTCVDIVKKAVEFTGIDDFIVINSHTEVANEADDALLTEFGSKFFNARLYMSQVAIYELGLTPTETDLTRMGLGLVPASLMASDLIHFNATGYTAFANKIADLIKELGG